MPATNSSFARLVPPRPASRLGFLAATAVAIALVFAPMAEAQSRNQFGRADRADGAKQLITLSVQQAISQLPPSAGQAFSFKFDPKRDTFVRSDRQGPTALLSPRTIGKGQFSARLGVSYLRVSESFDPIFYAVTPKGTAPSGSQTRYAKFGLDLAADVGVFDLSATYGVLRWLDVFLDIPIVLTDATASQTFVPGNPTGNREFIDFLASRSGFETHSLAERGTFPEGTNVGLGRVGVGARTSFYSNTFMELGAVTKFSFASPSSDELSGSDSYAIYPRLVGEFFSEAPVQAYADAGYEYDFSFNELSRFAWNVGASLPFSLGSFDLGVGGSVYDANIKWSPDTATGDPFDDGNTGVFRNGIDMMVADAGSNEVNNDVVNLLIGGRFEITQQVVVSTAITVALTKNGVRPDAVGTIAVEYYH